MEADPGAKAFRQADCYARASLNRAELAPSERWYVARALSNQENRAEAQMWAQGFRVFLPRVTRSVRHARKLRTVKTPAFPGYFFVALDLQRDRWRAINSTFGVMHLIMTEERPTPVPVGVVETLLDCVDENGLCDFGRDLAPGQPVRVVAGPLSDAMGEFVRLDGKGRVRVLLEIMGGKVFTDIERTALVAA